MPSGSPERNRRLRKSGESQSLSPPSIKGGSHRGMSAEGARRGMVDSPNLSGKRTEQKTAKLFPECCEKHF